MVIPTVICFGEVLWDSLPKGIFPGGAPVNVAYHLNQFGLRALPVTAVGNDFLGEEFLRRFKYWKLEARFAAKVDKPTGAVVVDLDERGVPSYRFLEDVAWDAIPLSPDLETVAAGATAIVFGTLAQRSPANRGRLRTLRGWAARARQVFDVNLRAPHDSSGVVWETAAGCDLIKLNDDELRRLLEREIATAGFESAARDFAGRTGCARLCVTAGASGAGLLWEGAWFWEPTRPVEVRDTVGAGDSFLAALIEGWLVRALEPAANLARAARVAEFIATRDGAMPAYSLDAAGLPQA